MRLTVPNVLGKLIACLAVVCSLLVAAGCGQDDDPRQTTAAAVTSDGEGEPDPVPANDEAAIEAVLDIVLTGADPAEACSILVTERYSKRTYGGAASCEAGMEEEKSASSLEVNHVDVLPDSVAQALIKPRGGARGGERLRAELVLDGGSWKLDNLRANVPVGP